MKKYVVRTVDSGFLEQTLNDLDKEYYEIVTVIPNHAFEGFKVTIVAYVHDSIQESLDKAQG